MPEEILFSIDTIGEDSSIDLAAASGVLSKTEKAKSDAYRFDKHRNRYIRGRYLLRSKLADLIDGSPSGLIIEEAERGKPFLSCQSIAFNLSHSGDVALFAFTKQLDRIGVDIEALDRNADHVGLSAHYFSDGEQCQLGKLSEGDQRTMFFKIWTAKEARMKLTGEGLYLPPQDIDLRFLNGEPDGYQKPAPTTISLEVMSVPEFRAIASVAADREFSLRPLNK